MPTSNNWLPEVAALRGWAQQLPARCYAFAPDISAYSAAIIQAVISAGKHLLLLDPQLPVIEQETLRQQQQAAWLPPATMGDPNAQVREGAAIVCTSGSSGRPRLIAHSLSTMLQAGAAQAEALGLTAASRWLVCLPLHHVAGLAPLFRAVAHPHDLRFAARKGTELQAALAAASGASLVPLQLQRCLEAEHDWAGLTLLIGGARCPVELLQQAQARGATVHTSYGMTETLGFIALSGDLLPGINCTFTNDQRIQLSGAWLPEPLTTTDHGHLTSSGKLQIDGRSDGAITSGGETVHPQHIATVIEQHPQVTNCAVLAISDVEWGEKVVCAYTGTATAADQLSDWCKQHLAPAAVPKDFRHVDALPERGIGKVDFDRIRELF